MMAGVMRRNAVSAVIKLSAAARFSLSFLMTATAIEAE